MNSSPQKTAQKKPIQIIFLIVFGLFLFILGYFAGNKNSNVSQVVREEAILENTISIMFDFANTSPIVINDISISENQSLADILLSLNDAGTIELDSTDYGGELGIFINSINDVGGDGNNWWQYWVNNMYSQIGVSGYKINAGDVVMFKYSADSFE